MPVTLCPIAIAVGCRRCPIFKVCPVKGVIGDMRPVAEPAKAAAETAPVRGKRAPGRPDSRANRKGRRGRPRRRDR